jgi:hypothetical protein
MPTASKLRPEFEIEGTAVGFAVGRDRIVSSTVKMFEGCRRSKRQTDMVQFALPCLNPSNVKQIFPPAGSRNHFQIQFIRARS